VKKLLTLFILVPNLIFAEMIPLSEFQKNINSSTTSQQYIYLLSRCSALIKNFISTGNKESTKVLNQLNSMFEKFRLMTIISINNKNSDEELSESEKTADILISRIFNNYRELTMKNYIDKGTMVVMETMEDYEICRETFITIEDAFKAVEKEMNE
tara:strand:+ start:602 stop:1069 length:468 start_codon:yes stop_codon:yes gene_type:complete